jgi:excisionase family DNA binding protein
MSATANYRNPAEQLIGPNAQRLIRLSGMPIKLSYTPKEAAVILDIGWRTVYSMLRDGRLQPLDPPARQARICVTTIARLIDPTSAHPPF